MKIAIIGAGCAGLVSAKHCLENNLSCDVYEQSGKIGGVWNYTDETGLDEYGLPIHTVMYKGLRTNLPKELMSYTDFPYPEHLRSFLTQPDVLSYMQRYATHFNLMPLVQFYKQVTKVTPTNGKWTVDILDVRTKVRETLEYDAVMICNGHYYKISMPTIDGMDTFKGIQMHSNAYRSPERFNGLRVLAIGAGPSGQDIASKIATVAQKVFISHRFKSVVRVSPTVIQKPVVDQISGEEILFSDGSKENVDAIVYCTGYKFDFPFLTKNCGVVNDGVRMKYLYKHVVNVEHPSMGFIGICYQICPFPVCDMQVQFFLATLLGRTQLKSKEEMIKDIDDDVNFILQLGWNVNQVHRIAERQKDYLDDLAKLGHFKTLPPVYHLLYLHVRKHRNVDECFKILDDNNYMNVECK